MTCSMVFAKVARSCKIQLIIITAKWPHYKSLQTDLIITDFAKVF